MAGGEEVKKEWANWLKEAQQLVFTETGGRKAIVANQQKLAKALKAGNAATRAAVLQKYKNMGALVASPETPPAALNALKAAFGKIGPVEKKKLKNAIKAGKNIPAAIDNIKAFHKARGAAVSAAKTAKKAASASAAASAAASANSNKSAGNTGANWYYGANSASSNKSGSAKPAAAAAAAPAKTRKAKPVNEAAVAAKANARAAAKANLEAHGMAASKLAIDTYVGAKAAGKNGIAGVKNAYSRRAKAAAATKKAKKNASAAKGNNTKKNKNNNTPNYTYNNQL